MKQRNGINPAVPLKSKIRAGKRKPKEATLHHSSRAPPCPGQGQSGCCGQGSTSLAAVTAMPHPVPGGRSSHPAPSASPLLLRRPSQVPEHPPPRHAMGEAPVSRLLGPTAATPFGGAQRRVFRRAWRFRDLTPRDTVQSQEPSPQSCPSREDAEGGMHRK